MEITVPNCYECPCKLDCSPMVIRCDEECLDQLEAQEETKIELLKRMRNLCITGSCPGCKYKKICEDVPILTTSYHWNDRDIEDFAKEFTRLLNE